MHTRPEIHRGLVAVVTGMAVACSGSATGGPAFTAATNRIPCESEMEATHCFELAVRNVGPGTRDGECWVAAIADFRTELARSEAITLRDVTKGERVMGAVELRLPQDAGDVSFVANCDPALEG